MSKANPKAGTKRGRRTAGGVEGVDDAAAIDDPRLGPGFEPAHFPMCDGGAAPPPGTSDPVSRRQLEFLAAYYRLNQLHARLDAIRRGSSPEDDRPLLREIQYAIRDRDVLEDKYEPEGFLGEPVMDGIYYRNIEFTHARSRQFYHPPVSSRFSLDIPLPPRGVDVADWVHQHLVGAFPELAEAPPVRSGAEPPHRTTRPRPPKLQPRTTRSAGSSKPRPRGR